MLELAAELKGRGHEVVFFSNAQHHQRIKSAGLAPQLLGGSDFPHLTEESGIQEHVRAMRQTYALLARWHRPKETVVVCQSQFFGARLAREKLGIPLVSIFFDLAGLVSTGYFRERDRRRRYQPLVLPELLAFRRELGLSPLPAGWTLSPDLVLGLFPEWWAPSRSDWPAKLRLLDFLWSEISPRELDPRVEDFLERGPPPLVFSLGSFGATEPDFFTTAVAACRRLKARAIIVAPEQVTMPTLDENFLRTTFVSFRELFPRVAGVVHHAGGGTNIECLIAGVPQLVMPLQHGQHENADLVVANGVGLRLPRRLFRPALVRLALRRLPALKPRCQELSRKMQPGVARVRGADLLEQLCAATPLPPG